ncbi:YSC84-related protein [Caballeronia sp. LP006]|uniref:BPSL1445 family SYLF domain-containing lipoprotein n=1 Tax=unclassified Caballeronia TaxID=2646786 RepID=UPI001FD04970|nr:MULTISPECIES: YSC84-related protein [unclassified Caballeronia]MDR5771463.1 YSC84-related protein [Caballeronia sp. LZ002]MDR5805224.1 YSC84-related protein [Caballeronia sp. LZ001]MDR5831194.1 YSC84-related protein [Caballeronia sp. LP006]MDR5846899.1 YSC84-related protein [Caballeronia sp. LZ003]
MQRRNFMLKSTAVLALGGLTLAGCTTNSNTGQEKAAGTADDRRSIDADVDSAIQRLYSTVAGSRELVAKSRGILVFPSVIQAGFIVGAQYGKGSLRVGGGTVGYYSTTSGSFGLQAGAQSKSLIFLFMTQDALDKFRNSDGWSAGADASVALVKMGANGAVDTNTATSPVEAFVLTNAGLMADVSLAGTKVTRLKM